MDYDENCYENGLLMKTISERLVSLGKMGAQLTHSCPPLQHLLSERLTSLGIMGEPEVTHLCRETQSLGQQMLDLELGCENATVGKNGLKGALEPLHSIEWL